jgi:hypothetical protein
LVNIIGIATSLDLCKKNSGGLMAAMGDMIRKNPWENLNNNSKNLVFPMHDE